MMEMEESVAEAMLEYKTVIAKVNQACKEWVAAIAEMMSPVFDTLTKNLLVISVCLRRVQLYRSLSTWLPDSVACFVADHWPKRWLPRLRPMV